MKKRIVITAFLILTACGAKVTDQRDPANVTINNSPMEGQINGQPWSMVQALAESLHQNGRNYLLIRVWNQVFPLGCQESHGSTRQIRITVPKANGRYVIRTQDMTADDPVVFFADSTNPGTLNSNVMADSGVVDITIDGDQVQVGLAASSSNTVVSGPSEMNGTFTAFLCH